MRYEWDSVKDTENRRKHGIAFEKSIEALDDPNRFEWVDDSDFYGEERIITLASPGKEFFTLCRLSEGQM